MKPRVFLDASVFIAAAGSPTGGSALVLELCRRRTTGVTSQLVLEESERNIARKMAREAVLRFYKEIGSIDLEISTSPTEGETAALCAIIAAKDAHVLAAALKSNVQCLLTLDRKHFFSPRVLQAGLPFQILTPGSFLTDWLKRRDE